MTITSTVIHANEHILTEYTCDGDDINPPLTFSQIPEGTKSLALIMDDHDAPQGSFTHWTMYDMSPATLQIPENDRPLTGRVGINDFGKLGYGGPCPPSGMHNYRFRLFALDEGIDLPEGAEPEQLNNEIEGHVIEMAELKCLYGNE
jgi:Raf kinase inhibitor-like YbhB/YbcL family protein